LLWSALDSFIAPRSLLFLHFQRCLLFLDSKLFLGNRSLAGMRDIFGATGLKDLFARSRSLLSSVWTERQDVPVFDLSFAAFRLIFWNTHADEGSDKASSRRAAGCAS
jgi:hypothetical protein